MKCMLKISAKLSNFLPIWLQNLADILRWRLAMRFSWPLPTCRAGFLNRCKTVRDSFCLFGRPNLAPQFLQSPGIIKCPLNMSQLPNCHCSLA